MKKLTSLEKTLELLPPAICVGGKNEMCYYRNLMIHPIAHQSRVNFRQYKMRKDDYNYFLTWEIFYALSTESSLTTEKYFYRQAHLVYYEKLHPDNTSYWELAGTSLEEVAKEVLKEINEKCDQYVRGQHAKYHFTDNESV